MGGQVSAGDVRVPEFEGRGGSLRNRATGKEKLPRTQGGTRGFRRGVRSRGKERNRVLSRVGVKKFLGVEIDEREQRKVRI